MAKLKFKFEKISDVSFSWIEQLYKDSYKNADCKVVSIIRARSKGRPWHDVTSQEDPATTILDLYHKDFDEVRLVVQVPNGYNYTNIEIRELHVNFKYPRPNRTDLIDQEE